MADIDQVEKIADPIERAREIGRRLAAITPWQEKLREMRQAAVLELKASRWTYAEIARELGLHRNRVQQIAEGRAGGGKGGSKEQGDQQPAE